MIKSRPQLRGVLLLTLLSAAALSWGLNTLAPAYLNPPPSPTAPERRAVAVQRDTLLVDGYGWPVAGESIDRAPQLSPDGSRIAYLSVAGAPGTGANRIVVRDLSSGAERDLTPESDHAYACVRWSPDGRSLAFVKFPAGNPAGAEVWRVGADGGGPRLLFRPGPLSSGGQGPAMAIAQWVGESRALVLAISDGTSSGVPVYMVVDAAGDGNLTAQSPVSAWLGLPVEALVGPPVFSPTGAYFVQLAKSAAVAGSPAAATPADHSLLLFDIAGQRRSVLGAFAAGSRPQASVAPDGAWIAVLSGGTNDEGQGGEAAVWLARPDGSSVLKVAGLPGERLWSGFVWAADGRAYVNLTPPVWMSRPDGALYLIDAPSAAATLVAAETWPARVVSVSRDGRRLLVVRDVAEYARLHLLELGDKTVEIPRVSPKP